LIGFKGMLGNGGEIEKIGFLYTGSRDASGYVGGPTNGFWKLLMTGPNIS
jgi:hypothetical protein